MTTKPRTMLLLATLAGLGACSVATPGGAAGSAGAVPLPPRYDTLDAAVAAARADAARRTGLAADTITVERSQAVTWRDGSLGCPQPDMVYTMALVPGWRVVLRAGGAALDYHLGRRGQLVLCPPGRAVDPIVDDR